MQNETTELKQDAISLHTKGEWTTDGKYINADLKTIASVMDNSCEAGEPEANAARIVKCVNAHDELVEQLKNMVWNFEGKPYLSKVQRAAIQYAKQALKKANQ